MKNESVETIEKMTNAKTMVFEDLCLLRVTVGTTGKKGGDSSHGCRTILKLQNDGCSDMRISLDGKAVDSWDQISIIFGGDCELDNLIGGLKFALQELSDEPNVQFYSHKDRQEVNFNKYLNELMQLYQNTGYLKGMTDIRNKYGVMGITKEEFFYYNLHRYGSIDRKLSSVIYQELKDKKNGKK